MHKTKQVTESGSVHHSHDVLGMDTWTNAQAIAGKSAGTTVEVETPRGLQTYTIVGWE